LKKEEKKTMSNWKKGSKKGLSKKKVKRGRGEEEGFFF